MRSRYKTLQDSDRYWTNVAAPRKAIASSTSQLRWSAPTGFLPQQKVRFQRDSIHGLRGAACAALVDKQILRSRQYFPTRGGGRFQIGFEFEFDDRWICWWLSREKRGTDWLRRVPLVAASGIRLGLGMLFGKNIYCYFNFNFKTRIFANLEIATCFL